MNITKRQTMTTSIRRRVDALERPDDQPCMSCEMEALNRAVAGLQGPTPHCTHWPRRTLAEELFELDSIERKTP